MNLTRQKNLPLANAAETGGVAALINTEHDLLYLLFAVPQQFDGKGTATDNPGFSISQELARFRGMTGHQRMPILIDHKHVARHGIKPSLRSRKPLASVQRGYHGIHTFGFRVLLMDAHRAWDWSKIPGCDHSSNCCLS